LVVEGSGESVGELVRFLAPRTVESLLRAMPLEGRAAVWKEEVYFEIGLRLGPEKAKLKVEKGAMAYWPLGSAVCVFYGDTQPYSPVNIIGRITDNLELFTNTRPGSKIVLERL